jgi:hypothetical protein
MATVGYAIRENDVVELREPIGQWPAGRRAVVHAERGDWRLIEISDDQGVMLDLISVRESQLKLVTKYSR